MFRRGVLLCIVHTNFDISNEYCLLNDRLHLVLNHNVRYKLTQFTEDKNNIHNTTSKTSSMTDGWKNWIRYDLEPTLNVGLCPFDENVFGRDLPQKHGNHSKNQWQQSKKSSFFNCSQRQQNKQFANFNQIQKLPGLHCWLLNIKSESFNYWKF